MSTTTIEIPSNFSDNILGKATAFFGELSPFLTTVIGILLAVLVVEIFIGVFKK